MASNSIRPSTTNSSNPRPRSMCPVGTSTSSSEVQSISRISFSSRWRMTLASVSFLNVEASAVNESMTSLRAFIDCTSFSTKLIVSMENSWLPGVIMSMNLNLPSVVSFSKLRPNFAMFLRKTFSRSTKET